MMYRCRQCGRWVRPWSDLAALCWSDRPFAERDALCGPCFDLDAYAAWNDLTKKELAAIERDERRRAE